MVEKMQVSRSRDGGMKRIRNYCRIIVESYALCADQYCCPTTGDNKATPLSNQDAGKYSRPESRGYRAGLT